VLNVLTKAPIIKAFWVFSFPALCKLLPSSLNLLRDIRSPLKRRLTALRQQRATKAALGAATPLVFSLLGVHISPSI